MGGAGALGSLVEPLASGEEQREEVEAEAVVEVVVVVV